MAARAGRHTARRFLSGLVSLAVIAGLGVASAPVASAADEDLATPLSGLSPDYLWLSATRAAGLDERGSSSVAWLRDLDTFGVEKVVSKTAEEVLVSVGRTAINSSSGMVLTDHGTQTARFGKWYYIDQLSGAYLIGKTTKKATKETVLANGKAIAFAKKDYPLAIFGSLVAVINDDAWAVKVYDVASGKPVKVGQTVYLDWDYSYATVFLWGDQIAVDGQYDDRSVHDVRVTDYRAAGEPVEVYREVFYENAGDVYDFSDGVLLLWSGHPDCWHLVDTATGNRFSSLLDDASCAVAPALDAGGRILYATSTDLVVHKLDFGGASAPRALWRSAATSFNAWSGETKPWTLAVDASKSLGSGSLVITPPETPGASPVTIPVAASADGSLRLSWDGSLGDTFAKAGAYTWQLEGFDGLVGIDGTTKVGGVLTVTNTPVAYPQATPVIDNTKPVTATVLTADPGHSPADATVGYQWYRGKKAISEATSKSYTVVPGDVGSTLTVKVSLTGSMRYLSSSKYSKATSKVGKAALVKGTAALSDLEPQVDTAVRADLDGWGPAPVTPSYQWYRVDSRNRVKAISKATKASYTPSGADKGYKLKVVVTGSKAGYASASVSSAVSSAVIAGAYSVVPTPTVNGTAKVGSTLTVVPGAYLHEDGQAVVPAFSYQWVRVKDGADVTIKGATRATYKATAADQGSTLKVVVVAKRSTYPTQTTASDPTEVVAAA